MNLFDFEFILSSTRVIQSCALNVFGGVEAIFSVTVLDAATHQPIGTDKMFKVILSFVSITCSPKYI